MPHVGFSLFVDFYPRSQAEEAQFWAQEGQPIFTASYLYREPTLPVGKKGEILAEAYNKNADRKEKHAAKYLRQDEPAASYLSDARQMRKVAQGLTRAAQQLQKS